MHKCFSLSFRSGEPITLVPPFFGNPIFEQSTFKFGQFDVRNKIANVSVPIHSNPIIHSLRQIPNNTRRLLTFR